MINRSKIKYKLKKILPKYIFNIFLILWKKVFIKVVEIIEKIRLNKFTEYHSVKITHQNKSFSLFISPENGCIDEYIYLYGVYEPNILDIIAKYLKKSETFVDIGSNIGQHSMFAASIVGNEGKVYSFEPIPKIYNQFLESIQVNNFDSIIKAYNVGLGEKDSLQTLYINPDNIGGSSLVEQNDNCDKIKVKIIKGDEILLQIKKICLIKIDVEGYEYETLLGIQSTIAQLLPTIIIEFNGELYNRGNNKNGYKIISLLQNLGYSLYDIGDSLKEIANKEDFLKTFISSRTQTDLLCLPKKIIL